jgi:predicted ATPase
MLKDTQHPSVSSAEKCFSEALRLAKHQGALFWELRSAVSLARLWIGQDRKSDASQILAPVCGASAKGLQIADVREARALLGELAGGKG